jgi:hypothetical protein
VVTLATVRALAVTLAPGSLTKQKEVFGSTFHDVVGMLSKDSPLYYVGMGLVILLGEC